MERKNETKQMDPMQAEQEFPNKKAKFEPGLALKTFSHSNFPELKGK